MKRLPILLCLLICLLPLASCGSSKQELLHLGINAVITGVDASGQAITVRDADSSGPLGEQCRIDCADIDLIYCNYETGDVKTISFEELQVEDAVILSIRDSDLKAFQEAGTNELKIEQLQLGTQRLNWT